MEISKAALSVGVILAILLHSPVVLAQESITGEFEVIQIRSLVVGGSMVVEGTFRWEAYAPPGSTMQIEMRQNFSSSWMVVHRDSNLSNAAAIVLPASPGARALEFRASWITPIGVRHSDIVTISGGVQIDRPPQEPQADLYGAIASDTGNQAVGLSYDHANKEIAIETAIEECEKRGGQNCSLAVWVRNGCAALVWGSQENALLQFTGWGDQRVYAEREALGNCYSRGRTCRNAAWTCTSRR